MLFGMQAAWQQKTLTYHWRRKRGRQSKSHEEALKEVLI
jgi:ribosomal protein L32E